MAHITRRLLTVVILISLSASLSAQDKLCALRNFPFLDADLIFVAPSSTNAITDVTCYDSDVTVDHVAILHRIGGEHGLPYAIEAIGDEVCLTPLDTFLVHNIDCQLIVARIPEIDIESSVRNALRYVGRPYDDLYLPTDSAIYCSELVQLAFVDAKGAKVFPTIPMSFHDNTGYITTFWQEHYAQHGMSVPEGEPGTNPAQLLHHPNIELLRQFRNH